MLPDIALIGNKRTGKDTIADYLVEKHGYTKLSFAEPLRKLAAEVNPCLPGGGRFNAKTNLIGYEWAKDEVPGYREFLEDLGLGARKVLGDYVWVDALDRRLYETAGPVVITDVRFDNEGEYVHEHFEHEFLIVHVVRPDAPEPGAHESESRIALLAKAYADTTLCNDADRDTLFAKVDRLLEGN